MEKLPVDLFAYYFQQYHPIKENDEWWGEGFTEWDLVKRSTPLFPDHYIRPSASYKALSVSAARITCTRIRSRFDSWKRLPTSST